MQKSHVTVVASLAAAMGAAAPSVGQCPAFDFENLTPDTVATNAIPGVTFTATPGSCGGGVPVIEVYEYVGGAFGTTNTIAPRAGCPDFSPDKVLMTFDTDHDFVSFRIGTGVAGSEIFLRWYNQFGTPLGTRTLATANDLGLKITIEAGAPIIRSVEVGHVGDFFEFIDELEFGGDDTPPTVELTAPAFETCVCDDTVVGIMGAVDDPDGVYACDRGEYRPVDADAGTPWTQFGEACGAFEGTLHSLNTSILAEGSYYVRVTGANACGLTGSDVTVIRVDRSFDTISLDAVADPLCGLETIAGEVSDVCGHTWVLQYRLLAGGAWFDIASGSTDKSGVIASWDTSLVADDVYRLRLRGTDFCGHVATATRDVVVDNAGCGNSADINGDGVVDFADLLLLLSNWTL